MKITILFTFLYLFLSISTLSTRFHSRAHMRMRLKSKAQLRAKEENNITSFDNSGMQSWVKFIYFKSSDQAKASQFFINEEYQSHVSSESDEFGPIDIPSNQAFFLVMMDDNLFLLSSRRSI